MYGSGLTVAGRLCRCPCAPGVLVFGGLAARSRIPRPVWAGGGAGTSGGQGCPPAGARVYPGGGGWWVLHTCACCVSVGAAESCGTALSVAGAVLFPCAQAPLTAHGSPTTTHDAHRKSLQFQRKPAPPPRRGPGLLCAISRTTAPTRHIRLPHNQSTTNSYRNSTDSQRGVWCVRTSETVRVSQMW